MRYRLSIALLGLAACTGSSYNQGTDLSDDDDGSSVTDDSGGGEEGGGSGEEGGGEEGGGEEGGDDGEVPGPCANAWHPIDQSGWSKDFTVVYRGNAGTGREEGMGAASGAEDDVYQYRDAVTVTGTSEDGWDVTHSVACDPQSDEGLYLLGYEGTAYYNFSDLGFDFSLPYEIEATLSPPRQYLPPEYAVGAVGSWDYSYTLTIVAQSDTGAPQTQYATITGTYSEVGDQTITLFNGQSVEAYKLTNTYTKVETSDFGETTTEGYVEQYWVKGLGLVEETHKDTTNSVDLLTRELTGYSGLTIE